MSGSKGSWEENRKLILDKLDKIDEIYDCVVSIKVKLAQQEVRIGIIGLLSGTIPVIIAIAVFYIRGKF